MKEDTFWPAMARCPDCGRFMKRGLFNWMNHRYEDCPKASYNIGFRDGMVKMYKTINHVTQRKRQVNNG